MVDCGYKKIQVKGERRRTDRGWTRDRQRTDEEINMDDNIVHIYFKGCWLRQGYLNCSQKAVFS